MIYLLAVPVAVLIAAWLDPSRCDHPTTPEVM
jgi:hypothetical protein